MSPGKIFVLSTLAAVLLASLSYGQSATCTGWKTFKVANEWNTKPYGINGYGTVVGSTAGSGSTSPTAPAFVRYSGGGISTYLYKSQHTVFMRRNSQGVTVGYYYDSGGNAHGIVVSSSNVATVNYPDASETYLMGINYWGSIVGYYRPQGLSNVYGFELKNGKFIAIDFPNSFDTLLTGINDSGVIVGQYWNGSGVYESFVLRSGTYTTIKDPKATGGTFVSDINNSGWMVGDYINGETPQSFLYENGTYKDIPVPNTVEGHTNGINGSDYVTGEAYAKDGSSAGFIAHCQ